MVFGMKELLGLIGEGRLQLMTFSGVGLFFIVGFLPVLFGYDFLNYEAYAFFLGSSELARSICILLVETGVFITVLSVMLSLYLDLASRGRLMGGL